jgi:hypothetical protein
MLPVSLDYPFLICPWVFSNLLSCVLCTQCYLCLWIAHSLFALGISLTFVLYLVYPMLPVSLDCPLLICPWVSSNLCFVYPMLAVSLYFPFLICPWVFSYLCPRDTGNIGYTRHRTKVRENPRANQQWAIQRHW